MLVSMKHIRINNLYFILIQTMFYLYNTKCIQQFLPISIGKLIAGKWDNYVYEYGDNHVIKFSRFNFFMGYKTAHQKVSYDLTTTKQFFWHYMLDTEIVDIPQANCIALVQNKIVGRPLHISDLQNEKIRTQFLDIVHRFNQLKDHTKDTLDLIGGNWLFWDHMGNIFVLHTNELVVIDVTLLNAKGFRYMRPLISVLFFLAIQLQRRKMARFMKYSYQKIA